MMIAVVRVDGKITAAPMQHPFRALLGHKLRTNETSLHRFKVIGIEEHSIA